MDWESMERAKRLFEEEEEAARGKTGVRGSSLLRAIIERLKELVEHQGSRAW